MKNWIICYGSLCIPEWISCKQFYHVSNVIRACFLSNTLLIESLQSCIILIMYIYNYAILVVLSDKMSISAAPGLGQWLEWGKNVFNILIFLYFSINQIAQCNWMFMIFYLNIYTRTMWILLMSFSFLTLTSSNSLS